MYKTGITNNHGLKTKATILHYPPYSPDFTPCDFRICTGLAHRFQSCRFQYKSASQAELKDMARNGCQKFFDGSWKTQGFAYGRSVYFWVDFLEVGTISATWYCDTLSKLKEAIRKKWPRLLKSGVPLHSTTATQNHIATLGWECLQHPPYNPDLAPNDFHLYPSLKKNLTGRRFGSNAEVKQAVKRFFRMQSPEFFLEGLLKLIKRYDKCFNVLGTYVEK
ncbi:mariner Mos1 transposase [Trichonephila clavipes]|nr:mariner Mos1 transposase [Trichonephila clavipes]